MRHVVPLLHPVHHRRDLFPAASDEDEVLADARSHLDGLREDVEEFAKTSMRRAGYQSG